MISEANHSPSENPLCWNCWCWWWLVYHNWTRTENYPYIVLGRSRQIWCVPQWELWWFLLWHLITDIDASWMRRCHITWNCTNISELQTSLYLWMLPTYYTLTATLWTRTRPVTLCEKNIQLKHLLAACINITTPSRWWWAHHTIRCHRSTPSRRKVPGNPNAPDAETTGWCPGWRDTSGTATSRTVPVPNATWSRNASEWWPPRWPWNANRPPRTPSPWAWGRVSKVPYLCSSLGHYGGLVQWVPRTPQRVIILSHQTPQTTEVNTIHDISIDKMF